MKNLTVTLFLTLIGSLGFAQNATNLYTAKIDSVQNILNKKPKDDTIKVRQLNDLALLCTFDMQFARGIHAAKQARQLSQKLHYLKGEGLYLDFMGFASSGLGWYYYYKKTVFYSEIGEKEEPNKLIAFMPQKIDSEKVIVKLLEALKYFEKDNDKEMMAHILAEISSNYQMLNKTNENIQYADQAIKLFKETGQPNLASLISINKIIQLRLGKKINEANEAEKEVKSFLTNFTDIREKALLYLVIGETYNSGLNYSAVGFEYLLKADYELEKIGETNLRILVLNRLGNNFDPVGLYQKSFDCFQKAIELQIESQKTDNIALNYTSAVFELISLKKWDEAKLYLEKAKSFTDKITNEQWLEVAKGKFHDASGQLLMGQGKYQEALNEFFEVNKMVKESPYLGWMSMYMNSYIAQCYHKLGDLKKSIFYGEKGYQQSLSAEPRMRILNSDLLAEVYEETGQTTKAFEYLKKYRFHLKEKEEQDINNFSTNLAIEIITQRNEQDKAVFEREKLMQRWWLFSIAAALFSAMVLMYILYRNNRQKQKANTVLENTLSKLKSTQSQLIQSEKLASLGQLTAGIAHEIKNPLNFVTNFSDLSMELIDEVFAELDNTDNPDSAEEIRELLTVVKSNLEKIHTHGTRADGIVKSMLQHSRGGSGKREPTDLNALVKEYVNLAFHGMRAGKNPINVTIDLQLGANIAHVPLIGEDFSRVILNLCNNAFDAMRTHGNKCRVIGAPYNAKLTVHTKSENGQVRIEIQDNGPGIPDEIKDKILQPFFTTKKGTEGTGLGLSITHDIVKAHGGELKVESKVDEGSAFIILLPM